VNMIFSKGASNISHQECFELKGNPSAFLEYPILADCVILFSQSNSPG